MDLLLLLTSLLRSNSTNIDRLMRTLLLRVLAEGGDCAMQMVMVQHPFLYKYADDVMVMWRNPTHHDASNDRFWMAPVDTHYVEENDWGYRRGLDGKSKYDLIPYRDPQIWGSEIISNDNSEDEPPVPHYGSHEMRSMSWHVYYRGIHEDGKQVPRKYDFGGKHYHERSGGHGKKHTTLRTHRDGTSRR